MSDICKQDKDKVLLVEGLNDCHVAGYPWGKAIAKQSLDFNTDFAIKFVNWLILLFT